jgi:hypothetical protein
VLVHDWVVGGGAERRYRPGVIGGGGIVSGLE